MFQEKLNDAFKLMRRRGLIARQDYACCQEHGKEYLTEKMRNAVGILGFVFYEEKYGRGKKDGKDIMLTYDAAPKINLLEVTKIITDSLRDCRLTYEWDGLITSQIKIIQGIDIETVRTELYAAVGYLNLSRNALAVQDALGVAYGNDLLDRVTALKLEAEAIAHKIGMTATPFTEPVSVNADDSQ